MPDLDEHIARGDLAPLPRWLREKLWRHGRKFTPQETLELVSGARLDPGPYLRYLQAKYGAGMIYSRVCVVGGGVIGSLYAAHLARVAEIWVLTRRAEHADALVREGLRVSGRATSRPPVARADEAALPELDLVILATKATAVEAVRRVSTAFAGRDRDDDPERPRRRGARPAHGARPLISGSRS